jgi:DNA-binding NarL/FixJ family response regulator
MLSCESERYVDRSNLEPSMAIRLLLVDDDAGFRKTLRHLLERRTDVEVLGEAGNGEEAVRLSDDLRPDAVLMDLAMPRMNGLEATRRLKARRPDLAVIILTVHDEDVYRRTALAAGATAFLQKKMLGVDLWPTLVRILNVEAGP